MGNKKNCISARSVKYWLDKGYNNVDAKMYARSRMPGTVEYFNIFKGFSLDEALLLSKEYNKKSAVTLENFITKYGIEQGTYKFNEYRRKQAESNSYEYKRKKYGWTKDDFDKFNKTRGVTLSNQIKKHGVELGTIKFNEYCDLQRYAGCKLDYFIDKYGLEDGTAKYKHINFLKGHSLESYMFVYNDMEIALQKHNEYLKTATSPTSNIANELFDELFSTLSKKYSRIYYHNNMQEWYIRDINKKRIYFVDFFVKDVKRVIEFNGDYWHANPNKYSPNQEIPYPNNTKKLANEVWSEDAYKLNLIKQHPDIEDVLIIWESDFRNNKTETIKKCLEFINQ